jgi:tetratricopeptide (TPR) repeat protein
MQALIRIIILVLVFLPVTMASFAETNRSTPSTNTLKQPQKNLASDDRGKTSKDLDRNQLIIKESDQAIRIDPNNTEAYINRGIAYKNLGQHKRAIEDLNQAIRLDPNDARAHRNRGVAYKKLGEYQRAININGP